MWLSLSLRWLRWGDLRFAGSLCASAVLLVPLEVEPDCSQVPMWVGNTVRGASACGANVSMRMVDERWENRIMLFYCVRQGKTFSPRTNTENVPYYESLQFLQSSLCISPDMTDSCRGTHTKASRGCLFIRRRLNILTVAIKKMPQRTGCMGSSQTTDWSFTMKKKFTIKPWAMRHAFKAQMID